MCTLCCLWFIVCSLLVTNASILNDLQEAQRFIEQLDYDYSAVAAEAAAQQKPAADLLWYDYGGGGSSGGGGSYYSGGASPASSAATAVLIGSGGGDKRSGTTQSSGSGIWFGPRLGRKKRRGVGGSMYNGGLVQPMDGNAIGLAKLQEAMAADESTATGQAVVSDLMNNAPWVFVPIVENSLFGQMQLKQNARSGRSSSEDGGEAASSSRHTARSPPYSPPFSPRLGRQATSMVRPQVPRLGRDALQLFRRDVRSAFYQQNAALLRQQQQQQQQPAVPGAATESVATAAAAVRRPSAT